MKKTWLVTMAGWLVCACAALGGTAHAADATTLTLVVGAQQQSWARDTLLHDPRLTDVTVEDENLKRRLTFKAIAVTAGYVCAEPRAEFYAHMDAANVDLKAFTEQFYYKLTGAHLAPVLETLEYIKHETGVWLETTTLLIPGKNDSDSELDEMTRWVVEKLGPDVPMHFSAFHPDWKMLDIPPTPKETLVRAREIAIKNGVHYAYTGNVHNEAGDSTYCHQCGEKLIGRDWYVLVYGSYSDRSKARRAMNGLPASLSRSVPWVRSFASIHEVLHGAAQ